jgi:hypothetical protein
MRDYLKMVGCSIFATVVVPALILNPLRIGVEPVVFEPRQIRIVDKEFRDVNKGEFIEEVPF